MWRNLPHINGLISHWNKQINNIQPPESHMYVLYKSKKFEEDKLNIPKSKKIYFSIFICCGFFY